MLKWIPVLAVTTATLTGAVGINDWLAVNGSNQAIYMRQRENGYRWTWDILQTEVWAWRFAVGAEAEFNHPRMPIAVADKPITGDKLVQRYGRYRDNIFDVRVGTFDRTLGKGLTLRSYNDRDFAISNVLDGGAGSACFRFGGREWGGVQALWGKNENRKESNFPGRKLDDKVWGGEVTSRPFDFIYMTASGVKAEFEDLDLGMGETEGQMLTEELVGGGLGGGWRYFDGYGEYAVRKGNDIADLERERSVGRGVYSVVNGYLPRSSISVEYKRYIDLWYPYSNPPPCSIDGRMITGGLSNVYTNEWGYCVKTVVNPADPLRLTGGYSYADDKTGENTTMTARVEQYFIKARYDTPVEIVAEAGYKYLEDLQRHLQKGDEHNTGEERKIPSLKVSWSPWMDHSFSVEGEREWREVYSYIYNKYLDNRASLGYSYSSWLGITGSYEDTNELVGEKYRNLKGEAFLDRYKRDWLWGEIRFSWFNKYLQYQVLTVGYGARRGGKVCSSGMCRQEPAFKGLKINLESTF